MALTPLEQLQTMMSGGGQLSSQTNPSVQLLKRNPSNADNDPSIALAALRDSRLSEMRHNLQRNPQGSGATQSDVSDLESDIVNDPYTGVAEHNRIAGIQGANDRAITAGYGGTSKIDQGPAGYSASGGTQMPAARMAQALRSDEMEKARIPLQQADVSGQTQRAVADIQGRNQVRTAQENEAGLTRRSHDALAQALGVIPSMGEGDTLTLQGGQSYKRGSVPFPTGPAGVALETAIKRRMDMEKPPTAFGSEALGHFMGLSGNSDADKAAAERALDAQFPTWRGRMDPGFKFAVPGAGQRPTAAPVPPGAAGPGTDPGIQRATAALQSHGIPVTPENLAEAKRQLGIQ